VEQWDAKPVWMLNLFQFDNSRFPGAGKNSYKRYIFEVRSTLQASVGKVALPVGRTSGAMAHFLEEGMRPTDIKPL